MALLTRGFDNTTERAQHWEKHGADFPELADAIEYEKAADQYLAAPLRTNVLTGLKRRLDRHIRFCPSTDEYGTLGNRDRIIVTYFRASPREGPEGHGKMTNMLYFIEDCRT